MTSLDSNTASDQKFISFEIINQKAAAKYSRSRDKSEFF